MTYSEYLFPNDMHIIWSLMIVTYPYITGLVAGAFIASALYHVFGREELKPVSRLSLLVSFAFLSCATLPLLLHLGHPERALNILITTHWHSAIAGFGFIYLFYMVILVLETWIAYREDIIENRNNSEGLLKVFWSVACLGVYEVSEETRQIDKKLVYVLSLLGIPAACTLHGYVGFLFGSLKSNPWWSTPLMPQVFLLSAIMSGLAMIILLYLWLSSRGVFERSHECLRSLSFFLWLSLIFYMISEGLEILFFFYESSDAWFVISTLLTDRLWNTFVIMQLSIGVVIPFVILTILIFVYKNEKSFALLSGLSSLFILFEVWMMRWNIVIGGQQFSKSYIGFRGYEPHLLGHEGVLATIFVSLLPLLIIFALSKMLSLKAAGSSGG